MSPFLRGAGGAAEAPPALPRHARRDRARRLPAWSAVGRAEDAALRQQVGVPGVVDMPEGTPLEETGRVLDELAASIAAVPEVTRLPGLCGHVASPINFNGLVRQYYLRMRARARRHPGEPGGQARARPAEPRDRAGRAAALAAIGRKYGAACRWSRCRRARRCRRRSWPRSTDRSTGRAARSRAGAAQALRLDAGHRRRGRHPSRPSAPR